MLIAAFLIAASAPSPAEAKTGKGTHAGKQHKKKKAKSKAKRARRLGGPNADFDRDGLGNRFEGLARTNPRKRDSDGDGVRDGAEDGDGDGVPNATEQRAGSNPSVPDGHLDPDGDGLSNRGEAEGNLDPADPDTDDDDVTDRDEHRGRITASSASSVTIALFGGGTLTGAISRDETDIVCKVDESDESQPPPEWDGAGEDDEEGFLAPILPIGPADDEPSEPECPPPGVGQVVYQADVEDREAGPFFVLLDLVGV